MLALLIAVDFGARRTACDCFSSSYADMLELGNVEAHFKETPKKPRTDLPSRLTECDLVTRKSSSISPGSES